MAERKKKEDEGPDEGWLATFGDLMSLLMTFFVLLLTFSSIQLDKFKKAMGSLRGALGVLEMDRGEKLMSRQFAAYDSYVNAKQELENYVEKLQMDEMVSIELVHGRGLKIVISTAILFNSGEARLKKTIYPILEKVGNFMKQNEHFKILVEGHTDNVPIHTVQFESNWELSASRALSVLKFFIDNIGIPPDRLMAVGHGEYQPIVPNTTSENRARNRRVEIYVEAGDYDFLWRVD